MTVKGRVTLRKDLLAHLGVRPGQRLVVEVLAGGRLQLHAEQATGEIEGCFGLLARRTGMGGAVRITADTIVLVRALGGL